MGEDSTTSASVSDGSVSRRSLRRKISVKNYNENLMDELIAHHLGSSLKRKNRTKDDMEKETENEAVLALSLGFPIDELLEEEIEAGVVRELGGKEQNDYIVVRNHILARWRSNVRVWLSKEQIRETVSNEYEDLVNSSYDFLLLNGYINFGVSPSFTPRVSEEAMKGSVVIVGAGLAGLAAAKQLLAFGLKVVVLEGRDRPGGRVYTQKMGQNDHFTVVDLGGSVITGIHANPLGVLARQLSIPLHKVRDECPLYKPNGELVDKETDSKIDLFFNKLLDKVTQLRKLGGIAGDISLGSVLETLVQFYSVAKTKGEKQLLNWHLANLEYANAGCLWDLSAAYWDQDDPYEMGGDHCFLAGGNWRLIKALCEEVPIIYKKPVDTIKYGDAGVEVISGDQVFQADMVLCTVPLGVLKKRVIKFEPELPENKLSAIERLGFGLLNKVAMVFPYVFWGEDLDTFGCLSEYSSKRGEFFLFYGYQTVSGGPTLVGLVAGYAAQSFESNDTCTLVHRVLSVLRGIYGPKGIDVPNPTETTCTRWGSDPFSYGSYSHIRVESSGSDYDILAENVSNKLFFAGEATSRKYPATMHGAYLSGLREASQILRSYRNQQSDIPKFTQKPVFQTKDFLNDMFKKSDLVFGSFSFVFDSITEDAQSMGIMRVTLRNSMSEYKDGHSGKNNGENGWCDSSKQYLYLYTILSRAQAQELQSVAGGDQNRLSYLFKILGLKLMGANYTGVFASSLIGQINSAQRGDRKSVV